MRTINLDNKEITDRIYDTLMKNEQWPQLLIDDISEQFVSSYNGCDRSSTGYIEFEYMNHKVKIKINSELI